MLNTTWYSKRKHFTQCGLLVLLASALSSCGSGWGLASTSSDATAVTLTVLSQSPVAGATAAEPSAGRETNGTHRAISFSFSRAVKKSSIDLDSVTIDVGQSGDNSYDQLVSDVDVNGNTVTLLLHRPLSLKTRYDIRLNGRVMSSDNIPLSGSNSWSFTVRDGVLGDEVLLSFLDPIGSLRILPNQNLLTAFEAEATAQSGQDNIFVVGVSEAIFGEGFSIPVELHRTTSELSQGGIFLSPETTDENAGLRSLVFLKGKPQCSSSNGNAPKVPLFVSQYVGPAGAEVWELDPSTGGVDSRIIDANLDEIHISWKPKINYLEDGTTVATWWAWTDFDAGNRVFQDWAVLSAARPRNGSWEPARRVSPPTDDFVGWPMVDQAPDGTLYALWGRANCAGNQCVDLFDEFDARAYTSYDLSVFDPATLRWSTPETLVGANLPRPTSFRVVTDERAVVLGRSFRNGPLAIQIELPVGVGNAELGNVLEFDLTGNTALAEDNVTLRPCGNFNSMRSYVGGQLPKGRLLPSGGGADELLVTWFGGDVAQMGPQVSSLHVSRFEFGDSPQWAPTTVEIMGTETSDVRPGVSDVVDQNGNITVVFAVGDGQSADSEVRAVRSVDGGLTFAALTGGMLGDDSNTVSNPDRCVEGRVLSNPHPSGFFLVGWNEQLQCGSSTIVTSVYRAFE